MATYKRTDRIKDPELLRQVRRLSCLHCGETPVDAHHVRTKASGGGDVLHNLMPICRTIHQAIHYSGLSNVADKNENIKRWLLINGWEFDGEKWRHE